MSKLYAIRGATTVDRDAVEEICARALELIETVMVENRIKKDEAVSLIASTTSDIRAAYPVKFIRESGVLGDMSFFSAAEPQISGGLGLCIRYLLHVQKDDPDFAPKHVYLRGAKILRPDIG